MTKIYLVECYGVTKQKCTPANWVMQVFTNKKLAKIYAEYWEIRKECFKGLKDIKIRVTPFRISKLDYTKELNELQIKNLPY